MPLRFAVRRFVRAVAPLRRSVSSMPFLSSVSFCFVGAVSFRRLVLSARVVGSARSVAWRWLDASVYRYVASLRRRGPNSSTIH